MVTLPHFLAKKLQKKHGILHIDNKIYSLEVSEIVKIETDFPRLIKGIGRFCGKEITLHIDKTVPPVARKHSRVPFQLREGG